MANTLYLSHLAEAKVRDLSSPQHSQVMSTLEALEQDPLGNSENMVEALEQDPLGNSENMAEALDLRVARIGDLRVILRYVPARQAVLVTDISPAGVFEPAAA